MPYTWVVVFYTSVGTLTVADPAMGGPGGRPPPIDPNSGLVMAARLRHRGKFSRKSLTFDHFMCKNVQKAFSFRGRPLTPHRGLCLWTPLRAPPPDPRLGPRSTRSPWSPLWQILDPPLSEVTCESASAASAFIVLFTQRVTIISALQLITIVNHLIIVRFVLAYGAVIHR